MKLSSILHMNSFKTFIGAALSGLVLAAPPVFAQSYTTFDIGTLGGSATVGSAINATGQVTGYSYLDNGAYHAFITQANGQGISDLGTFLVGSTSFGMGINARGQVVGEGPKGDLVATEHAFVTGPNGSGGLTDFADPLNYTHATSINDAGQIVGYRNSMLDVGGEGVFVTGPNNTGLSFINVGLGSGTRATDINASGQVVGNGHVESGLYLHAFITDKSHTFVSDLGTLNGGPTSLATAVNDSGQVVGASQVGSTFGPSHAFITTINSNMTDLGTLGGQDSFAWDVNSAGQVVGWSTTGTGNAHHAFVTGEDGIGMTDLNSLVKLENGTFLSEARAINDRGQILANASDGHAYLLSPVPEPETYAMLLAGLGLMGFMARRKKIA